MSAVIDLVPVDDLTRLAHRVNEEHKLAFAAAIDVLNHAILCGEALLEARELVPPGGWHRWVDETNLTRGAARRYMVVAAHKAELAAAGVATMERALAHLKSLGRAVPRHPNGRAPSFDVDEARRLRDQGLTYVAIGKHLGVSDTSIANQLDPRRVAVQYAARARITQGHRDQILRTGGPTALEVAKMLTECTAAVMSLAEKARANGHDQAVTDALRMAADHARKAEASLVRALRRSVAHDA